jgi:hypothetical protein
MCGHQIPRCYFLQRPCRLKTPGRNSQRPVQTSKIIWDGCCFAVRLAHSHSTLCVLPAVSLQVASTDHTHCHKSLKLGACEKKNNNNNACMHTVKIVTVTNSYMQCRPLPIYSHSCTASCRQEGCSTQGSGVHKKIIKILDSEGL